jgi:hypothetical protein
MDSNQSAPVEPSVTVSDPDVIVVTPEMVEDPEPKSQEWYEGYMAAMMTTPEFREEIMRRAQELMGEA